MLLDFTKFTEWSPSQLTTLASFLTTQPNNEHIWIANQPCAYGYMHQSNITFKQTLIQRKSKTPGAIRYEVVSNETLANGCFGTVYNILNTFAIDNENNIVFKTKHARVVKQMVEPDSYRQLPSVEDEYQLTNKAGHLGVKKPIALGSTRYLILKHIPGDSLETLLNNVKINRTTLSMEQRLELIKALLKAYQEQVYSKNIIHRDIKPENILIDLTAPITVTFIDFGLSIDANSSGAKSRAAIGTALYMAPEVFLSGQSSFKSDLFSLARVIGKILNNNPQHYNFQNFAELMMFLNNIHYRDLFMGIKDLSDENKNTIRTILMSMSLPIDRRIDIEDAIRRFDAIVLTTNAIDSQSSSSSSVQKNLDTKPKALALSPSFFPPAPPDPVNLLLETILTAVKVLKATIPGLTSTNNPALAEEIGYTCTQIQKKTITLKGSNKTKRNNNIQGYAEDCACLLSSLLETQNPLILRPLNQISEAIRQLSLTQAVHTVSLAMS